MSVSVYSCESITAGRVSALTLSSESPLVPEQLSDAGVLSASNCLCPDVNGLVQSGVFPSFRSASGLRFGGCASVPHFQLLVLLLCGEATPAPPSAVGWTLVSFPVRG